MDSAGETSVLTDVRMELVARQPIFQLDHIITAGHTITANGTNFFTATISKSSDKVQINGTCTVCTNMAMMRQHICLQM